MKMTDWHAISQHEVLSLLHAHEKGLSQEEAAARLLKNGPNALPREKRKTWWRTYVDQFGSPLMIVLIGAAGVSLALGDVVDASVIGVAVVLNSTLGFIQEYKASQAMERLQSLVEPTAAVRRDGHDVVIPTGQIVAGDTLVLAAGDRIPADVRVLECFACEANEAPLTGESMTVMKRTEKLAPGAALSERANMLFAGTSLVAGRAVGVAVAVGAQTELGKIAQLVRDTQERATPLQTELGRLAKWLSLAVGVMVIVLFGVGIAFGRGALEMFETSVALAVAAIPEGLGISVTIVLAIGMQRMVKRNALVRRLVAAETLGSVSVICTDKTGTITEGEMRVDEVVGDRETLLQAVMLCNDALTDNGDVRGTPTERALMLAGRSAGFHPADLVSRSPRVAEIPFDSTRKYMATLHAVEGSHRLIVKGAPERVLSMCRAGDQGRLAEATVLADRGLRLIAVAEKAVKKGTLAADDLRGLTFLGFIGLRDPLRPEAAEQIRTAREAGVHTVIVTGDHPKTAHAIGKMAGLDMRGHAVVTGEELDGWDDAELDRRVANIVIYARVEPRHKIRVVQAWQRRGEVVAVTGDGVNDAPALKQADIGVALGSGTEVAKEASDMVLLDNNLASITAAIREGRVIFDNMRRSVVYLFTSGFTEMILIAGALLFGLPLPLLPAQILWINLVADTFPNAALAFERGEPDIMAVPPRRRDEPVFNREMAVLLLIIGAITDLILFGLYVWVLGEKDVQGAQSFMFAAVGVASLVYVFSIRSFRRSLIRINPFSNPILLVAVALSFGLMVLALTHPGLSRVLGVTPLSLSDWALLLMIGVVKLAVIEVAKYGAIRNIRNHSRPARSA